MRTARPSMALSDPKSCSHIVRPRMTTASRPGTRCSSGVKARPMVGSTPISENRLSLTSIPIFSLGGACGSLVKPAVTYENAASPSKLLLWSRMSTKSGYEDTRELAPSDSRDDVEPTVTTSPGRATGSGRKSNASAKLKIALFAPIPTASERTETMVNAGALASMRQPYLTSCHSRSSQPIHSPRSTTFRRSIVRTPVLDGRRDGAVLSSPHGGHKQLPTRLLSSGLTDIYINKYRY